MALASSAARAQPEPDPGPQPLILEVRLNGVKSPLLWQFELLPDGSLATSADRLGQLGFDVTSLGIAADAPSVRLVDVPGVTYRYVDSEQAVEIDVVDQALRPVVLDAADAPVRIDPASVQRHFGAMLNYSLFGAVSEEGVTLSGQYEVRLLSRWGVLSSNGYANYATAGPEGVEHVRLDTYWRYVDTRRVIAVSVGDVIAEGGDLGVVYRLGGVQVRRDFGDRPDLVTTALPILSGTAAVPSAVDLYVNGVRYFSGETGPGPFQFRSLPNIGGGAKATVLLTDASGRETRIVKPIFFSPRLLPPGMLDFSAEAGFPRLNFGSKSFQYLHSPAASGSLRYGVRDWLTVTGHVEGMPDFANGGAGATVRVGAIGTVTAEFAASTFRGVTDVRYSIEAEAQILGINLFGGIERARAGYQDVVRVTALKAGFGPLDNLPGPVAAPVEPGGGPVRPPFRPLLLAFSSKTERAGASFDLFDTGVGLAYTRLRLPRQDVRIAGVSLNRTLFGRVSAWVNGYRDFGDRGDYGVFAGISLPLGNGIYASGNGGKTNRSTTVSALVSRDPGPTEGSWGWALAASEDLDDSRNSHRSATVRYDAAQASLEAAIEQHGGRVSGTAYAEGSVVAMGGGVFLSPRIEDSFAVVRGGGPDTIVLSNTREAARTGRSGRALVPVLSSFQHNVIAIDPVDLPLDLQPARTEVVVIPGDRAGVVVDFGVAPIAAALVTLVDAAGAPLPLGSVVTLDATGESAVVGYDGRVYLTGLVAQNRITVELDDAPACSASFAFVAKAGEQVQIGPLSCR